VAEISKIVGRRLQAKAKAGMHPDPNLISAFAEKSLGQREHLQVMEHLAQCSDCRDVVSLAIPQGGATTVIAAARGGSGWLSWPVLRWGALAACVIVVGAAVTLRYPKPESAQRSIVARHTDTVAEVKSAVGAQMATKGSGTMANFASPRLPEASSNMAASEAETGRASKQVNVYGIAVPAPRADRAKSPATSAGSVFATATAAKPVEQSAAADSSLSEMADARPSADLTELVPGRAKDALEESQAVKAKAATGDVILPGPEIASAAPQVMSKASLRTTPNLVPRWTLSTDGTLQRSLDSGRSWTTITVSNRTIFRALAASGFDIWVGGSGGALYHSSDAGEHWMRVQPVANGESLTADIIGVEFTDTLHGRLTTSNQETWTTADSGQTWQRP